MGIFCFDFFRLSCKIPVLQLQKKHKKNGLFMHNTHHYLSTCNHCTFSPFCNNDEAGLHSTKNPHLTIKQFRVLKRNEVLFLPKNKFHNLYVIHQGVLKTYQTEADGKELIRGFYFPTEILGYEAIHTGQHLFSAVALTNSLVCEILYEDFLALLHSEKELQKTILHLISQQLNARAYLFYSSAEQRIAAFLIDLSSRLSTADRIKELILPMSREDIGNYLRLTAETVSRILSRLQKNHTITISHKKITLNDSDKLMHIAQGF